MLRRGGGKAAAAADPLAELGQDNGGRVGTGSRHAPRDLDVKLLESIVGRIRLAGNLEGRLDRDIADRTVNRAVGIDDLLVVRAVVLDLIALGSRGQIVGEHLGLGRHGIDHDLGKPVIKRLLQVASIHLELMHRNVIPLDSAVRIERVPILNEHADIARLHGLFQRNGLRLLRRAPRFLGRGPLAVLDWSGFSVCILELHALGLASLPIHTEGLHITRRTEIELDPSRAGSSLGRPPRFAGRSIPIDRLLARKVSVLVARSGDFGLARDVGLGSLLLRRRARSLSRDIPNLKLGHGHAIRTVHTRNLELDELGIDGSIELEASDGPLAALPLLDRCAPVILVLARIQLEIGAAVGLIFPSDLEEIDLLDLL
ncbi:Uncharacterised protein [Collinsella intestinalis]|nr:Uncharacterised protein [Collinsella intestinalis]